MFSFDDVIIKISRLLMDNLQLPKYGGAIRKYLAAYLDDNSDVFLHKWGLQTMDDK